ncbi:DUF1799 domain-containing protein [Undibacterium sp. Di24W]|uniref:DUF1799 domain-containing protein n=1 Tax=Undibacterium sp. Di24W TaxID=3413033 RepID=UPI003BF0006C
MNAAGLTPEDYAGEAIPVFEDNEPVWLLFISLRTQWRVGTNGNTGLDYNVLYKKLDRMNLDDEEYSQMEYDISILEYAALEEMHKPAD